MKREEEAKCPGCNGEASLEPHVCPYDDELSDGEGGECLCCERCTDQCWRDI